MAHDTIFGKSPRRELLPNPSSSIEATLPSNMGPAEAWNQEKTAPKNTSNKEIYL